MGQLDNNLSENLDTGELKATQSVLSAMTAELENLKQNLIGPLNQELERLQSEKSRLRQEIDQLEQERQRQIAQQQQIATQLAQALASQLQGQLMQELNQTSVNSQASEYNENAYRLLSSLDSTLRTTFKTLQQDLNSYQSSLSQQLSHMHSMEQQGEAILEALVSRLGEQVQQEARELPGERYSTTVSERNQNVAFSPRNGSQQPVEVRTPPAAETLVTPAKPAPQPKKLSQVQLGFILVLLSTVALSVHNVIVRIVGSQSDIFGLFPLGGYIKLGIGNSLLVLWLRMIVVVPLLAIFARSLYPPVWTDIKRVLTASNLSPLFSAVASGCCLFLSQVLIYIAFGLFGNPGIPVTILFMYPIVTVPVAWILFRDRPSSLRIGVTIAVALGVILAAWPNISSTQNFSLVGLGTAMASGIAFAFYLIFIQLAFQRRVPPVPVSLIQFTTIFVLCSLSLMLLPEQFLGVQVLPGKQTGLIIGAMILGVLTLLGYLLNNFAVRSMGAAQASIVSSMGPALTAVLALLIIPSPQTLLQGVQWAGIILVTLAVGALSFEKLLDQARLMKTSR